MPSLVTLSPLTLSSPYFSLAIKQMRLSTRMHMAMTCDVLNTFALPQTLRMLKTHLPSVLRTQCFNDDNLPFVKEVQHTEIAHLFEHILLDYLCKEKIKQGQRHATHKGVTSWNWKKEPRGTFHIVIDAGSGDINTFSRALKKTMILVKNIFDVHQIPQTIQPREVLHAYTTL